MMYVCRLLILYLICIKQPEVIVVFDPYLVKCQKSSQTRLQFIVRFSVFNSIMLHIS